ncbi:hypothetical protein E1B28_003512 [Marasmius oreades]|uniref:F-box domain-containing protein n=1 Tax=Marasmius oreades TaxID=181124 RepID=A0A9P7RLZ8_9AGAR|nr:uncharacterized protein E1B28_003512 [Marasmius oreades]KAG7085989.1 hypothetical protein E1B28_003512 [Marasmius oreades]
METALTELKTYKNMVSPLLNLPTDVLSLIFETCAESDKDGHVMSLGAVPWVLSHICRRWRYVSLSYPQLWKVVRIDAYRHHLSNPAMLKAWLARSQPLPLSCVVRFRLSPRAVGFYEDIIDIMDHEGITNLLLGESQRWLDMSFELGDRVHLYNLIGTTTRPFPLLRYLRVDAKFPPIHRWLIPHTFNASAFASAPNLVEVSVDVQEPLPAMTLPWHQLKRYSDCGSTREESTFLDLAKLAKLEHFVYKLHPRSFSNPQPLHLVNLRRLDMFGWPWQTIIEILSFLHLPSLEDLFLYFTHTVSSPDIIIHLIVDLQERSSCRLKRLTLPVNLLTSPVIPQVVQHFSTVEELHLDLTYHAAIWTGSRPQSHPALGNLRSKLFFPRLRALYFVIRSCNDVVIDEDELFDSIADIIRERRTPDLFEVQLERLSFDTTPRLPRKPRISANIPGIRRIIELCSDGLVLIEPVIDGWLCPVHEKARHWNAEPAYQDAARFGGSTAFVVNYP